jgi:hypothetical protein
MMVEDRCGLWMSKKPEEDEVNTEGQSNHANKPKEATMEQFFQEGQDRFSFDHLCQFCLTFAGPWGFMSPKRAPKLSVQGMERSGYAKNAHEPIAPGQACVVQNNTKINCPAFAIRTGLINSSRKNKGIWQQGMSILS